MSLASKWISRCVARLRAGRLHARWVAGGLCVVMLAGVCWLVVELGSAPPRYAPLTAGPTGEADLAAAADLARTWGIDYRIDGCRLYVEPSRARRTSGPPRPSTPSVGRRRRWRSWAG